MALARRDSEPHKLCRNYANVGGIFMRFWLARWAVALNSDNLHDIITLNSLHELWAHYRESSFRMFFNNIKLRTARWSLIKLSSHTFNEENKQFAELLETADKHSIPWQLMHGNLCKLRATWSLFVRLPRRFVFECVCLWNLFVNK